VAGARLGKFVGTDDLAIDELNEAVHLELASGGDPAALAAFLTERVQLPAEEAAALVGNQNARLQERMHFIADRLEERDRPAELAGQLIDEGWPEDLAHAFVARISQELVQLANDPEGRKQLLSKSRRRMLSGLAWFGGGALVTWFTQFAADHGNSEYAVLAWGPIIYGIVLFTHAAIQWCRYSLKSPERTS
jgi:hypothetical protein